MVSASIILPTYNERENISVLIPQLSKILKDNNIEYEIIVVDDNSPDKTWAKAQELSRDYPVRVFVRKKERGLSSAIIYGARRARYENIVVMDADLQHPPVYVPDIIRRLEKECELVVASRYMEGGGVSGWSMFRLFESKVALWIGKILLPPLRKTSDPMSGFFGVKKKYLLNPRIKPRGFKLLVEVLVKNPGIKICDVPYVFRSRLKGESKLGIRTILDYIIQVIEGALYYIKQKLK